MGRSLINVLPHVVFYLTFLVLWGLQSLARLAEASQQLP